MKILNNTEQQSLYGGSVNLLEAAAILLGGFCVTCGAYNAWQHRNDPKEPFPGYDAAFQQGYDTGFAAGIASTR